MSRSGYNEDYYDIEQWDLIRWRGQVAATIRGRRGQAFLLEMWRAMDALPEKKLIRNELEAEGAVCAIGAVCKARAVDMSNIDPEDYEAIAEVLGIPRQLAQEIMFMNDDGYGNVTPGLRFQQMKKWIEDHLRPVET